MAEGHRLVSQWDQILGEKPDGSPHAVAGLSILYYVGDGLFCYSHDMLQHDAHRGDDARHGLAPAEGVQHAAPAAEPGHLAAGRVRISGVARRNRPRFNPRQRVLSRYRRKSGAVTRRRKKWQTFSVTRARSSRGRVRHGRSGDGLLLQLGAEVVGRREGAGQAGDSYEHDGLPMQRSNSCRPRSTSSSTAPACPARRRPWTILINFVGLRHLTDASPRIREGRVIASISTAGMGWKASENVKAFLELGSFDAAESWLREDGNCPGTATLLEAGVDRLHADARGGAAKREIRITSPQDFMTEPPEGCDHLRARERSLRAAGGDGQGVGHARQRSRELLESAGRLRLHRDGPADNPMNIQ